MIPLTMKREIEILHSSFFKKQFRDEFIYLFMKNTKKFDFQHDISKKTKTILIKSKKEYDSRIEKDSSETIKRNISKNLSQNSMLLDTDEFKELLKLSDNLLEESDYYRLLKKENKLGSYILKLSKLIYNSKVETEDYIVYKKKSKEIATDELLDSFEQCFKERLYQSKMCRQISVQEYKSIEKKEKKIYPENWCAYIYTYLLDVSVCPYCNSQYIYTYQHEESGKIRAELDHCFPKTHHPLLAVSLYNLIPSCSQCNSSIKGDTDVDVNDVMNLFTESFLEKYSFYVYSQTKLDSFIGKSLDYDIKIIIDKNFKHRDRLHTFLSSFHIEERYNFFKKHLNEQIYYQYNHSDSYNEFLEKLLKKLPHKVRSDLQKQDYIETKPENRILGKLTSDILERKKMKKTEFYSTILEDI